MTVSQKSKQDNSLGKGNIRVELSKKPVPLWMAINLKQGQKCRIIPPDWMDTALE
jgi:hypothetical protein